MGTKEIQNLLRAPEAPWYNAPRYPMAIPVRPGTGHFTGAKENPMTRLMFALMAAMFLMVGCHNMKKDGCCSGDKAMRTTAVDMSKVDVCAHCPGVQHLTADGKCEGCKMAVADVCPMCPGVQVKLADGGCSGCGCKVE